MKRTKTLATLTILSAVLALGGIIWNFWDARSPASAGANVGAAALIFVGLVLTIVFAANWVGQAWYCRKAQKK